MAKKKNKKRRERRRRRGNTDNTNNKLEEERKNSRDHDDGSSSSDDDLIMASALAWAAHQTTVTDATTTTEKRRRKKKNGKRKQQEESAGGSGVVLPQQQQQQQQQKKRRGVEDDNKNHRSHDHRLNNNTSRLLYPPPFPLPSSGDNGVFLRDVEPHRESFQTALDTAYEGCVYDLPQQFEDHQTQTQIQLQNAFQILDLSNIFRTDVTQPAGLGSKCAPTYVTRCLLGDEGTTYWYLGMRMFSHPWNITTTSATGDSSQSARSETLSKEVREAIDVIYRLNQKLTERTSHHLTELAKKRRLRLGVTSTTDEPVVVRGRAGFDVTLINKCTVNRRLKPEPMYGVDKCSVSWHADSSLEHYSTIAVYQILVDDDDDCGNNNRRYQGNNGHNNKRRKPTGGAVAAVADCNNNSNSNSSSWSVALRVAHDAEGPRAKRLGDISVQPNCPPIMLRLPSGSAYYLLDDHNHHHQHTVLAPSSSSTTTRFSSTHRLLRHGGNVNHVLERCRNICIQFNKKSLKRFRSEQLILTEIENKWLRQFFVQGAEHKRLLWYYWREPIMQLLQYWEKLEERTRQVVLWLKWAAEQQCDNCTNPATSSSACTAAGDRSSNNNKKLRENRKKACRFVHDMLLSQQQAHRGRGGGGAAASSSAINAAAVAVRELYNGVADLLRERAKSRELWSQREHDPVYKRMPLDRRPLPFPVEYNASNYAAASQQTPNEEVLGHSPLPSGSPSFLNDLASNIAAWGECYISKNASQLPRDILLP